MTVSRDYNTCRFPTIHEAGELFRSLVSRDRLRWVVRCGSMFFHGPYVLGVSQYQGAAWCDVTDARVWAPAFDAGGWVDSGPKCSGPEWRECLPNIPDDVFNA
jgi:hypothetical protein